MAKTTITKTDGFTISNVKIKSGLPPSLMSKTHVTGNLPSSKNQPETKCQIEENAIKGTEFPTKPMSESVFTTIQWRELPLRSYLNGILHHVPPTFNLHSIDWLLPAPTDWTRAEIATAYGFLSPNVRIDMSFIWQGGGTIELFVCNATELSNDNWSPNDYYRVFISSADTPYLETSSHHNNVQVSQHSNIELSSNYKNSLVNVSIVKDGSTWSFYRNGNRLDQQVFSDLDGKRLALIIAPSHNYYKGPPASISLRSISIKPF